MIENPILMPPVKTRRHIGQAISVRGILMDVRRADGVNAKIAVFLTNIVGSMWCAYVFAIIVLLGLRPALRPGGEGIIAWIAQTFLQLSVAFRHYGRAERAECGERYPFATHL